MVSFRYLQCCFGLYALGDVTDIALNHLGSINRVDVAYKLHVNSPTVFGFKRQILVADNPLRLERTKSGPGGGNILKRADFPEFLAHELTVRIAQHLNQKWVHVGDLPSLEIENQYSIFGGFKEPPVASLGVFQRLLRFIVCRLSGLLLRDVYQCAFDHGRCPAPPRHCLDVLQHPHRTAVLATQPRSEIGQGAESQALFQKLLPFAGGKVELQGMAG